MFKKVVTSLLASFALSKTSKISKAARLTTHLQDMSSITGTFEESTFAWNLQNIFFSEHISVAASWNYVILSTLSFRGTPRFPNAFESASFMLDTKSVLKINYGVPKDSATKHKKHKVQNWVNTDIFNQHFRYTTGFTKSLEYSFVTSFKTCCF